MKISSIVFDLDGTLVSSRPGIVASMREIVPEATDDTVPIGPKLQDIIRALRPSANDEEIAELTMRFRDHYDREGFRHTELFPAAREVLESLGAQGFMLSIATNKRAVPTEQILNMLNVRERFAQVLCIDSLQPVTTKPEMIREIARRTRQPIEMHVMVGDSQDDEEAARAVGVPFWFASYGYGKSIAPELSLSAFADLLVFNERFFGTQKM